MMTKRFFFGCIFMVIGIYTFAQEKDMNTSISNITVFIQNAQITRTGSVQLPAGRTTVSIPGLSAYLNSNTLQIKGTGKFTILGVNHKVNYLDERKYSAEVEALIKKIEGVTDEMNNQNSELQVLKEQEDLLQQNRQLKGENTGMQVEQLKQLMDYYTVQLKRIKASRLLIDKKIKDLREEKAKLDRQLNELNGKRSEPTSTVEVELDAPVAVKAQLEMSYVTPRAGWAPEYDIRASDINNPVIIHYKASIYQNTGEDWKDVKLILSNANPNMSGNSPVINPWYLGFYQPTRSARFSVPNAKPMAKMEGAIMEEEVEFDIEMEEPMEVAGYAYAEVSQGQTTVEFSLESPFSLPSTNERKTVDLTRNELQANYEYRTTPKLDNDAFLVANITDWGDYNFIPGQGNIYFGGTYIGKTYLNPQNTSDTLQLSLGRDQGVVVTRTKGELFSAKKAIGQNKTDTREWNIEVRNNKNTAITLVIVDQIPISTNSSIEINHEIKNNGVLDPKTGKIEWKIELEPKASWKTSFQYTVKYPKNKKVILE